MPGRRRSGSCSPGRAPPAARFWRGRISAGGWPGLPDGLRGTSARSWSAGVVRREWFRGRYDVTRGFGPCDGLDSFSIFGVAGPGQGHAPRAGEPGGGCEPLMIPKYTIEYCIEFNHHRHAPPSRFTTDDPVSCEDFLAELLDRGGRLVAVRHEGADLPVKDADRMIKGAAARLAARKICASLRIDAEEEHRRFGFPA